MTAHRLTRRAALALFPGAALTACAPADRGAVLDAVLNAPGLGPLSAGEAAAGIREALANGVFAAIAQVGRTDGYFSDGRIHIPLPRRLAKIQSNLRPLGLSGLLDDLELQINRGAETAAPEAKAIFLDAIGAMTIQDALGIVNGGPTSATQFFQRETTPALTRLFTPPIRRALQRTGAIRSFDQLVAATSAIPLAPQIGADAKRDLISHGVGRGLDGLFHYVGREEAAIRANPAKRTSELLRRVFG